MFAESRRLFLNSIAGLFGVVGKSKAKTDNSYVTDVRSPYFGVPSSVAMVAVKLSEQERKKLMAAFFEYQMGVSRYLSVLGVSARRLP